MPDDVAAVSFRLQRWFAGLGALLIGLMAVPNDCAISRFLTGQLLQLMQLLQAIGERFGYAQTMIRPRRS